MKSAGHESLKVPGHIPELDGIRGLAALLVFFHHLFSASVSPLHWGGGVLALRSLFVNGDIGVDLFFVLSGYLITSILLRDRPSSTYYRDFYWKRALRVLPLLACCLTLTYISVPNSGEYVILSALFLANFAWLHHILMVGPYWTLAIEEQFYLIWPTLVRRRSTKQVARWAVIVALSAVAFRFMDAAIGHWNYAFTFMRCDGLAVGALLACRFAQRDRSKVSSAKDQSLLIWSCIGGVFLFIVASIFPDAHPWMEFAKAIGQTGRTLACGGSVGLMIALSGRRALAPMRSRSLVFFGMISYAVYMLNGFVIVLYDKFNGSLRGGDVKAYVIRVVVISVVTVVFSLLSRYVIELPALSLRSRVLGPRAVPAELEQPVMTG